MATDVAQIRDLLDEFTRAIRNKDAAGAIATLAEDAVAFDLAPPLRIGPQATRDPAWYDQWFTTWKGPIVSRSQDLEVAVGGDVGYAYGLQHMTGTKTARRSTSGSAPPPASGAKTATGASPTCTIPCPFRWTAVKRRCSA